MNSNDLEADMKLNNLVKRWHGLDKTLPQR